MSRQELFAAYLIKFGWHEEPSKSRKYRTFARDGCGTKFFLGRCGAVRKGPCTSKSHSVTDAIAWDRIATEIEKPVPVALVKEVQA